MSMSKRLPAALTIGLVLATAAAVLIGLPPKELPDRLAVIPDEAVVIDNYMYDTLEWGQDEHPLKMVNYARIPYFVDKVSQHYGSRNRTLLDVGCGGGVATLEMAKAGFQATGIDMSAPSIKHAADTAREAGLSIDYIIGNVYKLPFEDNSFDAVLSSDVLEHLHDLPTALSELQRVLKPGGILVFDTINRSWFSWIVLIRLGQDILRFIPLSAHSWLLFITPEELTRGLQDAGLEPCSPKEFLGMGPSLRNPVAAVARLFRGQGAGAFLGPWNQVPTKGGSYLGYALKK